MRFKEIAQRFNMQIEPQGAFGTVYGYEVSIITEQRWDFIVSIACYLFKNPFSNQEQGNVQATLKPLNANVSFANEGRVVRIQLPGILPSNRNFQRLDNIFRTAANTFSTMEAFQIDSCALCNEPGYDKLHLIRNLAMRSHNNCYEKMIANIKAEYAIIDATTTNLGKGYFYALIGATIGVIINLLVVFISGYQFALLYALVPVISMFMYKKAKAPLRKEIPFVLAGISIVFSMITVLLLYLFIAYSYDISLSTLLSDGLTDFPNASVSFMTDMITGFLFGVIGVFIVWRYLYKPRK